MLRIIKIIITFKCVLNTIGLNLVAFMLGTTLFQVEYFIVSYLLASLFLKVWGVSTPRTSQSESVRVLGDTDETGDEQNTDIYGSREGPFQKATRDRRIPMTLELC